MEYFSFQWHITDECDQRCEHCYIFSENNNIPLKSMTWEEILHTLNNIYDMCEKTERLPYIYLTGGDPILHKYFWDLLHLFKQRDIPFSIMGNPFHLTVDNCRKMLELCCKKYQLSIDGLEQTHDFIRKKGSFQSTLKAIDIMHQASLPVAVMTTVSGMNINEIPAIVDLVVEKRAEVFAFARYCPTSLEKDVSISPTEYRNLLETLWQKFEQYKDCATSFNLKDHLFAPFLYEKGYFKIPDSLDKDTIYDGCNCGTNHVTITPNGDVMACRRCESIVGNIFSNSLYDIWNSEKMDFYRQYDKFEACKDCELLRFCRGCPSVAYGVTHNFYAKDPQCWFKK
ncbi:MAG: radical SAM/SPASM domain protein, ACGX system [Bacteroidales bacterium]|nr:radical SAM/SPASM domain protein, ACGX system [Bacteroidales bacterium]